MDVRYTVGKNEYKRMTTDELRGEFLVDLFEKGTINLLYCEVERVIVGAAVPTVGCLKLEAGKELASDYFCQRREVGVLNIGGNGTVTVDGTEYAMENLDGLYIGRGSKEIIFDSVSGEEPARFYLISYPAHTDYPSMQAKKADANAIELGSMEDANKRTIYQYIHENGSRYTGQWLDDVQEGEGEEFRHNGSKYKGQYQGGKKHGYGIFVYSDGSQYSGYWEENKMAG